MPWQVLAEGQMSLGVHYNGWNSNYVQPFNGYEILSPLTLSYQPNPRTKLYAQTEYGTGSYTDSVAGTETVVLTNFSDTVVGGEFNFKSFELPSVINLAVNIPTGDATWETKQIASNIPTEFVDSRYRGRGFGMSLLYGLSFPEDKGEFGMAVGYLLSQSFNPSYGQNFAANNSLKLGDSAFLALNHVQPGGDSAKQIARASVYYSTSTLINGLETFRLGTNFTASYAWSNPKAFSLEFGAQAYLPSSRLDPGGNFVVEAHNSFAPRFLMTTSYAFGDFVIAGRGKYILTNDYTTTDLYYDGGGWLLGIEPSYRVKFDDETALKFSASFDDIYAINLGVDNTGSRANVNFYLWTVGTTYELKL